MKIGDQKQAMGLGVVAFFALGMLGKSAFGAFASGKATEPIVVKDIGGQARGTQTLTPSEPVSAQPEKTSNTADQLKSADPTIIKREAFEKPDVPVKTRSFDESFRPATGSGETLRPTGQIPPADPDPESLPGGLPEASSQPNGEQNSDPKKESRSFAAKPTARFDGFVDAGRAMAVVTVMSKNFSVSVGDFIGMGYRVVSISSQLLTIRKGKVVKKISIGKETNI